jgi:hypothetical protein
MTLSTDLSLRILSTLSEATKSFESQKWEDATLDFRNALGGIVIPSGCEAKFGDWNIVTRVAKEFLETRVTPRARIAQEEQGISPSILNDVTWIVLAAIMEDYYRPCDHGFTFFDHLLRIYEDGHIPCGWADGKWPKGTLLVY